MADDANPRAIIGDNAPPAPSPYEAIKVHIDDLYAEAKNWLDGEPITTAGQAEAVETLLGMIREAEKAADEARKLENEPFDHGKAAVQERYNLLIGKTKTVTGKTVLAADACKAALLPWREAQEAERRAAAEAARKEAEAKAAIAAEAARSAAADNLTAREEAEARVKEAEQAATLANRAEKAATTGSGLRTTYKPALVDGVVAARHYWETRRSDCEEFFTSLAREEVRAGKRQIPGFEITPERSAF